MRKTPALGIGLAIALAAPAAASAATLSQSDQGLVYQARSGEINRLAIGRPTGLFNMPVTEYAAPLDVVGGVCMAGTPVLCPAEDVFAYLGNMDDVASALPFAFDISVFAGAGNDDVGADGVHSSIDGGSGDDILRLNADGLARATGGRGDDQIAGLKEAGDDFDGGDGNDLVVATAAGPDAVRGADGNDQLVVGPTRGSSQGSSTAEGNAGDDVITFLDTPVDGWTFDAGRGADVVRGPAQSVDAGPGNDLIDVVGGSSPSTVICGRGFDTVWADSSDAVNADCEQVYRDTAAPEFPGVADAIARAQTLLNHVAQPDPSAAPVN